MRIVLLIGLLAMVVVPLAASAEVILSVEPNGLAADSPSGTVTLSLFMTTEIGTSTDNATWSVGCNAHCSIHAFVFNEAYGPGSGLVTWGVAKTIPPFAAGGTQTNLNTSGSLAGMGDGQGTIIGDGSYVGSIGFITPTQPLNGDGTGYLIGTLTVQLQFGPGSGWDAIVTPFFRPGEGTFNLAPTVPTQFVYADIFWVPEPGTASLLALGLGGLALVGRRARH